MAVLAPLPAQPNGADERSGPPRDRRRLRRHRLRKPNRGRRPERHSRLKVTQLRVAPTLTRLWGGRASFRLVMGLPNPARNRSRLPSGVDLHSCWEGKQ